MSTSIYPQDRLYFLKAINCALLDIEEQIAIAKSFGSLSTKRECVEKIREITDRLLLRLGGDL